MKISRFTKAVVLVNGAVPLVLLGWDALNGALGANPVNFAIRTTGLLSLIFLALSLAITPASRLTHQSWLGQFRRPAGLYAFYHTALHFWLFFWFDRGASIGDTASEILLRPYLAVGIIGLVIMVPLAVTSTDAMIRRMGPLRWKRLHRLAYVSAIAGGVHFYMLVKADTTRPLIYAVILAVLLGYRLVAWSRGRKPSHSRGPAQWTGKLRVASITRETPDVRTFRLVLPDSGKLPFEHRAGQYLNLTVEINGQPVRRSYTIASPGTRPDYCELSIKREENGLVSRHLHDTLREGDLIQVTAPAGRFTFDGTEAGRLVLIAGGVGITPLMAKIRQLTDQQWDGSIQLIFSVKSEQDIIFRAELEELQRKFPNLRVAVTITRDANESWTGERGRINPAMLARVAPEITQSRVHLCGPTEMTEPLIAMLKTMGVPAGMIKSESFASPGRGVAGKPVAKAAGEPQKPGENATLAFVQSGKNATGLKGRTILEIAEDHDVVIPYDCRSGICGQCKIKLLSGSVVMDSEDALDDADRAEGLILGCQARCVDDVQVDA